MLPDMHQAEPIPDSVRADIERLLQSGDLFRYTAPDNAPVKLLEQEFAAAMGARYALAVSSCSAALFLSLAALGLAPGARVLIPGFTFAAVPSAVIHAGCVPVLCEVGADYRIDMADFEERLPGCAAVIVSHMRGHTSDMDAILRLCDAARVPVIEDAAHSLGTVWRGRKIGTLGRVGCFSFQSYKLINAGEGGVLISDDPEVIARAVILSGAYEHSWKKHDRAQEPALKASFERWQNRLPLYNLRLSNLSAAVIRAQIPEIARRVRDGRANHDRVAEALRRHPAVHVPRPLDGEERAPDSLQFSLPGMAAEQIEAFVDGCGAKGLSVQVFGRSRDNARAFWNWGFLPEAVELPRTRAMLMQTCDIRLPARLTAAECDAVTAVLLEALDAALDVARAPVPA
ncbi:DegT/DnrJ/EryC1/StrS aminotransferase family protein [Cognatishimia sp. F0-27]|uniref:DegT/DnrJ/EryC1/StrS family aminotransferase n=1 Tax=Cognatishimia sp. F0-27 TaxID=2816855 RepID=UPI001D0C73A5|nr:aminotransferase class I/II-fold pyridoxal phosphate-dependent enzyme [Cognatishimia sp. F0-27]MCC1493687.1 aminotransferase class I/II-fold pyridoxal phosphate-dependent enzyme [Cognatishimia sp. F0-27]